MVSTERSERSGDSESPVASARCFRGGIGIAVASRHASAGLGEGTHSTRLQSHPKAYASSCAVIGDLFPFPGIAPLQLRALRPDIPATPRVSGGKSWLSH
jgi:hypothetical protein